MWESIIDRALHIVEMAMEGQTKEQRAEFWQMYLEDIKELRAFIKEHKIVISSINQLVATYQNQRIKVAHDKLVGRKNKKVKKR